MRRINFGAKKMLENFPILLLQPHPLVYCRLRCMVSDPSNPKSCVKIPVNVYIIIAHTLLHGPRERLSSQTSKERVP